MGADGRAQWSGWLTPYWKGVARQVSAEPVLMVDLLRGLDCVRADKGGLP